jgi:hypothetical protein
MTTNLKKWMALMMAFAVVSGVDLPAAEAPDRYYLILFAYEGPVNLPGSAHSFATFMKVSHAEGNDPEGAQIEGHTISWLPATLQVSLLRLRPQPGRNLDLETTLNLATSRNASIFAWGPFRIRKELYARALAQIDRLNRGEVAFRTLDASLRPDVATNCFHAISDIVEGPLLDTGLAYGQAATELVLEHFSPWIIEPRERPTGLIERLGLQKYSITYHDPQPVVE